MASQRWCRSNGAGAIVAVALSQVVDTAGSGLTDCEPQVMGKDGITTVEQVKRRWCYRGVALSQVVDTASRQLTPTLNEPESLRLFDSVEAF